MLQNLRDSHLRQARCVHPCSPARPRLLGCADWRTARRSGVHQLLGCIRRGDVEVDFPEKVCRVSELRQRRRSAYLGYKPERLVERPTPAVGPIEIGPLHQAFCLCKRRGDAYSRFVCRYVASTCSQSASIRCLRIFGGNIAANETAVSVTPSPAHRIKLKHAECTDTRTGQSAYRSANKV